MTEASSRVEALGLYNYEKYQLYSVKAPIAGLQYLKKATCLQGLHFLKSMIIINHHLFPQCTFDSKLNFPSHRRYEIAKPSSL